MIILVMCGIAMIATAFIIFVTIRFQTMEAVYFNENGKKGKGEIIEVDKSSAEYHSGQKNQSYDIRVRVIHEDNEYEGAGVITEEAYADHLAAGSAETEIDIYYDPLDPTKVIFYDPAQLAERGKKSNKIAMALMLAGFVLFIAGRVMM